MPTSEFYSSADDNLLYQYPLMLVVLDVLVILYIVVVSMIVGYMYKKGNFDDENDNAGKTAFYLFLILLELLLCFVLHHMLTT